MTNTKDNKSLNYNTIQIKHIKKKKKKSLKVLKLIYLGIQTIDQAAV